MAFRFAILSLHFSNLRFPFKKLKIKLSIPLKGINQFNHTDGTLLPHTHGFDYVGHILPFSLEQRCDDTVNIIKLFIHRSYKLNYFTLAS